MSLESFTGSSTFTNPSAVLGTQSALKLSSTGSESFNLVSSNSSFLDQNVNQQSSLSSTQLPIGESYSYSASVTGGIGSNIPTTADVPLEAHGSGGLVGDIVLNVNQSLPNQNPKSWSYSKQDYNQYSQNAFSTLASTALASSGGGLSVSMSHTRSHGIVQTERPNMRSSEDYLVDQTKLQGGFIASNGYGSLDDLIMMKKV